MENQRDAQLSVKQEEYKNMATPAEAFACKQQVTYVTGKRVITTTVAGDSPEEIEQYINSIKKKYHESERKTRVQPYQSTFF